MLLRESCAGCREAVGEALTAARVGRALSIVNLVRSAEAVSLVEGNTDCTATGEGQAGSAVSKTSRHARTSSIGRSSRCPGGSSPGPQREGAEPRPMMHDAKKSDRGIVPTSAANKGT